MNRAWVSRLNTIWPMLVLGQLVVPFPLPMMYYWAMTHLFGRAGLKPLNRVAREKKRAATPTPAQAASVPIREREAAE